MINHNDLKTLLGTLDRQNIYSIELEMSETRKKIIFNHVLLSVSMCIGLYFENSSSYKIYFYVQKCRKSEW